MKNKTFTLTEDHLKLIRRMYVGWSDCEYGAPEIDPKRPYGNSDVTGDIAEILGWVPQGEGQPDDGWTVEEDDRAHRIHRETQTALQIILCCGPVVGTYEAGPYDQDWELIS